jgi:hypothetical protein
MLVTVFASCLQVTQLDVKNFFEELCGEVSARVGNCQFHQIKHTIAYESILLHMLYVFFLLKCALYVLPAKMASFAGFSVETSR